ncbi:hypothetical protein HY338_00125 [Candidatus Gottesmanbacteria bacterium]|nr:hypothetical protein [Candidatus Gottesmanbacteria bacterium]
MNIQHTKLQNGGWQKLSLMEQLANVGSEVERAIKWKNKNNPEYSQLAFFRVLELLDFSLVDKKNISRLSEITRLREVLVDYFFGKNIYASSDEKWQRYFYNFTFASRAASYVIGSNTIQ